MINTDRIVPVTKIDLISLYGLILLQDSDNSSMVKLAASTIDGVFACGTGIKLADQPVKTCNFTGSSGTLYFVPDYAFAGFTVDGSEATIADGSDDVVADGHSLYSAVLATGEVTITKLGF